MTAEQIKFIWPRLRRILVKRQLIDEFRNYIKKRHGMGIKRYLEALTPDSIFVYGPENGNIGIWKDLNEIWYKYVKSLHKKGKI